MSTKPIEFQIPVHGHLVKCYTCGKSILVETALNGTDHNIAILATCWDCMTDEAKLKAQKMYPNLSEN